MKIKHILEKIDKSNTCYFTVEYIGGMFEDLNGMWCELPLNRISGYNISKHYSKYREFYTGSIALFFDDEPISVVTDLEQQRKIQWCSLSAYRKLRRFVLQYYIPPQPLILDMESDWGVGSKITRNTNLTKTNKNNAYLAGKKVKILNAAYTNLANNKVIIKETIFSPKQELLVSDLTFPYHLRSK